MSKLLFKKIEHQYSFFKRKNLCCVCGQNNCQQSIDHQKITLTDVDRLFNDKLKNQNPILQIKHKISLIYQEIKLKISQILEKDQYELQVMINKFSFPSSFTKLIDLNFIAQLMEHNIEQLPSKKINSLIKKLNHSSLSETNISTLNKKYTQLMNNFKIQTILQGFKNKLPSKYFKQQKRQLQLKPKTFISSQISNPEEENSQQDIKVYEWRNIRVTKNSKTASFSNKNITDRQVMEQIPFLVNFKNLQQFQIRNNKISSLSCNLIANNLPFLLKIDIRGNNIDDKGIIKLINGIPKMKSFSISQTLTTDVSGEQVASKLDDLQMFWSQHTKITNVVALKIAQRPKIKVLSLVGNPIDNEYKQKMKKLFMSKGYIAI